MTLTEAKKKVTEVTCNTAEERELVIKLIEAGGLEYGCAELEPFSKYPNIMIYGKCWNECIAGPHIMIRTVPASDFIKSNK